MERRPWEVSGREEQSTEQIRRLFARYREMARRPAVTVDVEPAQREPDGATAGVPDVPADSARFAPPPMRAVGPAEPMTAGDLPMGRRSRLIR
jgi:hypothetical protein